MTASLRTLLPIGAGLGLGGAAFALGSSVIGNVRQHDLAAPPFRPVSDNGRAVQEVSNTPLTGPATVAAGAAGVLLAAGAGALLLGRSPFAPETSLMRALVAIGLLGAGIGFIGGAVATESSTADVSVYPSHAPARTGISISSSTTPATTTP